MHHLAATAAVFAIRGVCFFKQRPCGQNARADHRGHWAEVPDQRGWGRWYEGDYTRIEKPRRVTVDPVIYVCRTYADPERNARRAENFCRYVWKMGGIRYLPCCSRAIR